METPKRSRPKSVPKYSFTPEPSPEVNEPELSPYVWKKKVSLKPRSPPTPPAPVIEPIKSEDVNVFLIIAAGVTLLKILLIPS